MGNDRIERELRKDLKNDKLVVKLQKRNDKRGSSMLTQSEESRRIS